MATKHVSSGNEASKASKTMRNPHSSKVAKSLAASVLSQARTKRR
jgi:hypothetical protein